VGINLDEVFIDEDVDQSDVSRLSKCDSNTEIVTDNLLTVYGKQYIKPRTLSGTNLTYHYPSPMHAVLLQYEQTMKPENQPADHQQDQEGGVYRIRRVPSSGSSSTCSADTIKFAEDFSRPDCVTDASPQRVPVQGLHNTSTQDSTERDTSFLTSNHLAKSMSHTPRRNSFSSAHTGDMLDNVSEYMQKYLKVNTHDCLSNLNTKSDCHPIRYRKSLSDIHEGSVPPLSISRLSETSSRSSHAFSTRSSASSKLSLTSEEGYFSHPGSPRNKKKHKLSIQSDISFGSTGSSQFVSDQFSEDEAYFSPTSKQNQPGSDESPVRNASKTPLSNVRTTWPPKKDSHKVKGGVLTFRSSIATLEDICV